MIAQSVVLRAQVIGDLARGRPLLTREDSRAGAQAERRWYGRGSN
jgi:hypothetical protein